MYQSVIQLDIIGLTLGIRNSSALYMHHDTGVVDRHFVFETCLSVSTHQRLVNHLTSYTKSIILECYFYPAQCVLEKAYISRV